MEDNVAIMLRKNKACLEIFNKVTRIKEKIDEDLGKCTSLSKEICAQYKKAEQKLDII